MPWETDFLPYMKTHWKQGEHVCLVAPTGEGKTVFETQLIGRLRRFVLIFDAKGDDATLDGHVSTAGLCRTSTAR
jgi:type IV secretory pathway VirB4 component